MPHLKRRPIFKVGRKIKGNTIVYKGRENFAWAALEHLQAAGLTPEILEDPSVIGHWAALGTYVFHVAVSAEEASKARELINEWRRGDPRRIEQSVVSLRFQFLISLLPAAAAALVMAIWFNDSLNAIPVAFVVWLGTVVLWGVAQKLRERQRASPGKSSHVDYGDGSRQPRRKPDR